MFVIYAQRAEGLRWVKFVTPRRNIAEMKLLEIDKVVQSHATPEEPAWVWMEEIPDGTDQPRRSPESLTSDDNRPPLRSPIYNLGPRWRRGDDYEYGNEAPGAYRNIS